MDFNDEKFTFIWNIENLICLRSTTEQKVSTSFRVSFLEDTDWELRLLFKSDPISKINALLCRLNDGPQTIQIDLGLYFSDSNGLSNFEIQKKEVTFGKGKCFQSKPRQLYKNNFINETLVLKCVLMKSYGKNNDGGNKLLSPSCVMTDASIDKMLKDSFNQSEGATQLYKGYPNRCSAVTRFKIEQRSAVYHIKQFQALSNVTSIPFISVSDLPALMLTLQSKKDSDEVEVCVHISEEDIEDFVFVKCKISALSDTQNSHHILEDTNVFKPKEDTVWKTFPILKSSVSENIQNGVLSLRMELTIYDGESTTEVREVGYAGPPKIESNHKTLSDQLFQFFVNQILCDVTLKTPNDSVRAHKIVICAKSPVFRAMFENEMSEKLKQVVDILDVDISSLKLMLTYMYSEKFENIVGECDARKLYSAADKYQYDELKKKCSDFLTSNLQCGNVCQVLELADLHNDSGLKMSAQTYIKSKCSEILSSNEWRDLIGNNAQLASETLVYISTSMLKP